MRVHSNERPEECMICGSRFTKKSHLRKHVTVEHSKFSGLTSEQLQILNESTPHVCSFPDCGKSFTTEGKLKAHEHKHEEKPHVCGLNDCGLSFSFRKDLLKHQKSDHIPKCDVCGKEFKNTKNLSSHKSIHKVITDFVCPHEGCLKAYSRKSNLNTHIKQIHTEGKQEFKCQECDDIFGYKHTLERHIEQIHRKKESFEIPPAKKKKPLTIDNLLPNTLLL
jgi:uncharacterized Zn-finger protein